VGEPGPNAASQRRTSSARARAGSIGGTGGATAKRNCPDVQPPSGRVRRIRPSTASTRITPLPARGHDSYAFPGCSVYVPASSGTAAVTSAVLASPSSASAASARSWAAASHASS
jgi:hypothetical protein